MSSERPARPPRRRTGDARGPSGARPPRRGEAGRDRRGRPGRPDRRQRPERPLTAAEQRAAEVRARRGPRGPRDPDAERARIAERTLDLWEEVDTAVRDEAIEAAARAARAPGRPSRREQPPLDPGIAAEIRANAADRRVAERTISRLAQASEALERDRLDEARRLVTPIVKSFPGIGAVHELAGLVAYRLGNWRTAARELEAAQALQPNVGLLPVLADAYRALQRWDDVERVWREVREISPAHEILAEGRIVAAGALADQGDLPGALRTMEKVSAEPKRVRDYHLRQWYVLGDLHDRAGNTLEAVRWFELVRRHDADFVDVAQRLRGLGRR